jgi:hypothetical protein
MCSAMACSSSAYFCAHLPNMAYSDPKLAHFSLRGRRIDELRALAKKFLHKSDTQFAQMTKLELISELSEGAAANRRLPLELRKAAMSLKPDFYVLRFSDDAKIPIASVRQHISQYPTFHSRKLAGFVATGLCGGCAG